MAEGSTTVVVCLSFRLLCEIMTREQAMSGESWVLMVTSERQLGDKRHSRNRMQSSHLCFRISEALSRL